MDVAVGSPNFGRLLPCTCKLRDERERNRVRLRQFADLTAFRTMTFETFDATIRGALEPFQVAVHYAESLFDEDEKRWLVLVGDYGCGKTHLAAAIANYALEEREIAPVIAVVPDLLDYLRTTFGPAADDSYDDRFNAFRNADLLILDDLGTENATPWAREKLFQIINHRYNTRMPMVVTTNDLDRVDPRIRSRLCDWQLARHCFVDAPDYRGRGIRPRGPAGRGRNDSSKSPIEGRRRLPYTSDVAE